MSKEIEDKAKEIVDKFYDLDEFNVQCSAWCYGGSIDKKQAAKQCAIIHVDGIIEALKDEFIGWDISKKEYYEQVKSAIQNLQS